MSPAGFSTVSEYAARYNVPKCLVTFVLGMSVPVRSVLRLYLTQMLDTLEGKIEEWVASGRRANKVHTTILTARDAADSKLDTARKAVVQIPVAEIARDCASAVELLDVLVKGVGSFGVEGVEDLQAKSDDLLYEASRLDVVSTGLARAKESANIARIQIEKWISLIDAMPS